MARPPILRIFLSSRPDWDLSKSIKNKERPSEGFMTCSIGVVRARRIIFVATCAEDIHLFEMNEWLDMWGGGGDRDVESYIF